MLKSNDLLDRNKKYFGLSQYERLKQQTILLIGAGAIGNEVVKNLVMLGISKIFLVDFDRVENSNLNRCVFFRPQDHKKEYKVFAVKREAEAFFPESCIIPYSMKIQEAPDDVWNVPLVIIGVDNDYARYWINMKLLSLKKIPFVINGAMGKTFFELQVLKPGITSCLCCSWDKKYLERLITQEVQSKCDEFFTQTVEVFPAISTITSLTGAMMVTEAVKILTSSRQHQETDFHSADSKSLLGKYLRYNTLDHELCVGKLLRNPKCVEPLCSEFSGSE